MVSKIIAYPLDTKVLAVAVVNIEDNGLIFDWSAYIKDVPGFNHEVEKFRVASEGDKLSRNIANAMFPQFDIKKYRL